MISVLVAMQVWVVPHSLHNGVHILLITSTFKCCLTSEKGLCEWDCIKNLEMERWFCMARCYWKLLMRKVLKVTIERREVHKGTRDLRMLSWLLYHGPKDIEVFCYVEMNKRIPQIHQKDNTQSLTHYSFQPPEL